MRNVLMVATLLAGCADATTLTVVTHDSFHVSAKLVAQFSAAWRVDVKFVRAGDAGQMLNRLILTRQAPFADVVYGLDNSLLPRAQAADILEPYASPALKNVPASYRLGSLLNTVDYGWVAFNYDKAWFRSHQVPLPTSLEQLATPRYARLTVVENPETSSPGLAFLLATVQHFGADKAWVWWRQARQNRLLISRGWEDAYFVQFTRYGGAYPIVLSYASSPAIEVANSGKPLTVSPTANVLLPGSTFLQLEGAGVVKGSKQPALAHAFIDFLLSKAVQTDFPTRMWVYPALKGIKLDPLFRFAQVPTVQVPSGALLRQAPTLLDAWVEQVERR